MKFRPTNTAEAESEKEAFKVILGDYGKQYFSFAPLDAGTQIGQSDTPG